MRKWRFPIALCFTQTAVTAVLTLWADRVDWLLGDSNRIPPTFLRVHMLVIELRLVWRGVNAPTLPFNFAGQKRFQILGLSVPEILYLFSVAALWFSVGYFSEQAKEQNANPLQNTGRPSKTIAAAILVWGIVLFLFALLQIREAFPWEFTFRIFSLSAFCNVFLYTVWAALLIRFGFKALASPVNRPTRTGS